MKSQHEASIVRIFRDNQLVVGTGFLVDTLSVLSCAHVVASALGLAEDTAEIPDHAVVLDFPLVAPGCTLTAHVSLWQPPQQNGGGDIAVLTLDSPPPEGASSVRLVITENVDLWEHRFRAFGFPSKHSDGVWVSGKLRGQQAAGWMQIEHEEQTGYRVQQGFSGGAIWDEQLNGVVGMVVAAEQDPTIRAAYVIPASAL